jgi:hypothetical protein
MKSSSSFLYFKKLMFPIEWKCDVPSSTTQKDEFTTFRFNVCNVKLLTSGEVINY